MSGTINILGKDNAKFEIVHGPQVDALLKRFDKLSPVEKKTLLDETVKILSNCRNPVNSPENIGSTTGITVGYVQSGKTMSFTTLTALAVDNDYRIIIYLTGVKNNLLEQTTKRLKKDLDTDNSRVFKVYPNPSREDNIQGNIKGALRSKAKATVLITVLKHHKHIGADLLNWMSDKKQLKNERYLVKISYQNHRIPYFLKISSKIDNDWTSIFWEETKNTPQLKDRIVDPPFMRFIMRTLLSRYMAKSELAINALADSTLFTSIMDFENFKYQGLAMFEPIMSEICQIEYLEKILDRYAASHNQINKLILASWDYKTQWKLSDETIGLRQYVLFYGVIVYLEHNEFEENSFSHWIRVVWNIIIDPELRRNTTMISYVKAIDRLAIASSTLEAT